jgi:hypothetical protein
VTPKPGCCFPIMRTAGWYHSNFCPEHAFEKLGRAPLHDRRALRAEIVQAAARTHDWARCDVYLCGRCAYIDAHLDDADDRFPA